MKTTHFDPRTPIDESCFAHDIVQQRDAIPFLDLQRQTETLRPSIEKSVDAVIRSAAFIGGPHVDKFEIDFAAYCETKYCIGVGSGTDALFLVLKALGVGLGDEVITVPNTFVATAATVVHTGASVVFVGIDPETSCISLGEIEAAITPRTKAIIPVHLFGHPCDMQPIMDLAERHRLFVLEDAAQAHGATYAGRKVGSLGHAAAFSFYPGKNLGAYGDGGAITTSDKALASKIRKLRDHGRIDKYVHEQFGFNSRLDALQAAVLSVKLRHLDSWNARRREVAARYDSLLSGIADLTLPKHAENAEPVWHLYSVRTPRRAALQAALDDAEISYGMHYPVPLHLQPAWSSLTGQPISKGVFPVVERHASQLLSLPMHESIRNDEVDTVARVVRSVFN